MSCGNSVKKKQLKEPWEKRKQRKDEVWHGAEVAKKVRKETERSFFQFFQNKKRQVLKQQSWGHLFSYVQPRSLKGWSLQMQDFMQIALTITDYMMLGQECCLLSWLSSPTSAKFKWQLKTKYLKFLLSFQELLGMLHSVVVHLSFSVPLLKLSHFHHKFFIYQQMCSLLIICLGTV